MVNKLNRPLRVHMEEAVSKLQYSESQRSFTCHICLVLSDKYYIRLFWNNFATASCVCSENYSDEQALLSFSFQSVLYDRWLFHRHGTLLCTVKQSS